MTYPETLDYLYQRLPMFQRVGPKAFKKDLTNIIRLCAALDNPERKFRSVHVAGTNGKGSVSNMLASVLQEADYRVGLYTSPHLRSFTERIRLNGAEIPETDVVAFVERSKSVIEAIAPSFFEVTVAMAFDYFARQEVDIAVVEVGLGGRLDSTNVIVPEMGVVTNISYDHMNFLGNTLGLIAGEKAGIFKAGKRFVIGQRHPETEPVFHAKAAEAGASLVFAEDAAEVRVVEKDLEGQDLEVEMDGKMQLRLGLAGEYQRENARTALVALKELEELGWEIGEEAVKNGLERVRTNTGFRGRMSVLGKDPLVLTDVGHNEAGVGQILNAIAGLPHERLHLVWGSVFDKDVRKILEMLPADATYYFVSPNVPRGMPVSDLVNLATEVGLEGVAYSSVAAGLEAARAQAQVEDLIFVGGSTFVVAEII